MSDETQRFIERLAREEAERRAAEVHEQCEVLIACGFKLSELTVLHKQGEPSCVMPKTVLK